jgi:cold shock CspA family protein
MAKKLSELEQLKGKVVLARFEGAGLRNFGFISRDDGGPDVFFSLAETEERIIKRGSFVNFVMAEGNRARRVWLRIVEEEGNEHEPSKQPA